MMDPHARELTLGAIQQHIQRTYGNKDQARGDTATFLWFCEEVGELAAALRAGSREELAAEMADVLAWLATLANLRGIDLETAFIHKYGAACPGCQHVPCNCDPATKP